MHFGNRNTIQRSRQVGHPLSEVEARTKRAHIEVTQNGILRLVSGSTPAKVKRTVWLIPTALLRMPRNGSLDRGRCQQLLLAGETLCKK